VWQRQQRIEKSILILAPKVDAIMTALEEAKKRAEKMAAQPQGLPPAPTGKSRLPIPENLIEKGLAIAEKVFSEPEPKGLSSMIEETLIKKAVEDIIQTVSIEREIGSAVLQHVKKHGLQGTFKFEGSE